LVSWFRSSWRLLLYLLLTGSTILIQGAALILKLPWRQTFPMWYHRQVCRIAGLKVERRGRQSRQRPTLYVINHVSYLDIEVVGSLIKGSFVAKAEVKSWPLFGLLARLQRSVFVERRAPKTAETRDEMGRRLESGENLMLFPEGTSGDGNRVLPFKSALFSVAERRPKGQPLTVQAVSVAYAKLDGLPMGRYLRPYFAWYGDMDLFSHIWGAFGIGKVTAVVEFHPPVTFDQFGSRKAMAEYCQAQVQRGLTQALTGRPQPKLPAPMVRPPPAPAAAGLA
jgi:1-acyl-sn-glycerol-3-phosphate acyltransferase